jgi:hypothetical protein
MTSVWPDIYMYNNSLYEIKLSQLFLIGVHVPMSGETRRNSSGNKR